MCSASANTLRILHIIGSPKGEHSLSTRLARTFLDAYVVGNPDHEITTLDVWAADLPPVDGEMVAAKFAPFWGEALSAAQEAGWARIKAVVEDFASYDKIVLSTPMWNYSVPYALKHYFDILVQPGMTYGLDADYNHVGTLHDRPVQLVLTRSSPLPEGSPEDFQLPYIKHIFGFMGLKDIRTLIVEGTTLPQEAREAFAIKQCKRAAAIADDF